MSSSPRKRFEAENLGGRKNQLSHAHAKKDGYKCCPLHEKGSKENVGGRKN
jgi:hypothetical protein